MATFEVDARLGMVKTDGTHGVRGYDRGFDVFDALVTEPLKHVSHLVATTPDRQNGVGVFCCEVDVPLANYRPE